MRQTPDVSIAMIGSGGAGALTAGNFVLEAACAAGWHGLLTRSVGPQIRGGEAAALPDCERVVALPHRLGEIEGGGDGLIPGEGPVAVGGLVGLAAYFRAA